MQTKDRISAIRPVDFSMQSHGLAGCGSWVCAFYLAITIYVSRLKVEGDAVHAVAFACGFGAVVEDVAEVGIADGAGGFCANHKVAEVFFVRDVFGLAGVVEAGPAST